jgi:Tol biopolymer transport system component
VEVPVTRSIRSAPVLLVAFSLVACESATEPARTTDVPVDARMEAVSPTSLTATVNTEVASPPTVRVTDGAGRPRAGVEVTFSTRSGGTPPLRVATDGAGIASYGAWRLGFTATTETLTARAGNLVVQFNAIAVAGPTAEIRPATGDARIGMAGSALSAPVYVAVLDRFGNPVSGVPVTFNVVEGGGHIPPGPVISDAAGLAASGTWTLGTAGLQRVRVSAGDVEFIASAEACDRAPCHQILLEIDGEIHVLDLLTGATRRITDGTQPAWSPDGGRIAFTRARYESYASTFIVHVMNADGSGEFQLASGSHPSWSPDGRSLAFQQCAAVNCAIYVMDASDGGSEPRLLAADASMPAWSPDGRIAFVSRGSGLEVVAPDGSGRAQVFAGSGWGWPITPAWSPDGRQIAFVYGGSLGGSLRIWDGSAVRTIPGMANVRRPTWSPMGTWIAFERITLSDGDEWPVALVDLHYLAIDTLLEGVLMRGAGSPAWGR